MMNDPVSILVVDDRRENLLSLEALLRGEEIEVMTAASGREALGLSLKHDFALVLLDVQMPEMDGFETAELMRGNPKTRGVPIMFVTAGEKSNGNLFKGYESGAVDYIYKPVDPVILCGKVRVFSELYRQKRALERQEQSLERQVAERTRDLRNSEERYRRLLDSVSSYVYSVFCREGVPVHTEHGQGCEAVSGYSPEEFAADSGLWLQLVPAEDRPQVEAFTQRILCEKTNLTLEHRIRHRDGTLRWIQNTLVPRLDACGQLLSYDGVISDISRRRQAEERLCRALELASASSRAKSEFLANMSHEIRTPMTGIMGAIDLLHHYPLGSEQQEFLDIISTSATTLLTLLDDILDLSKIEAGKTSIVCKKFSLRTCLNEVIASQLPRIREKELRFTLKIQPDVPEIVCGDALRIKQIVLNLLGNAIKFTSAGEIALIVDAMPESQERFNVRISISDTGIGIKQDALERIFLPFEQADGSMTRRYGGSGLGLSICQRLTNLMGGEIAVESEERRGSTFTVTLPLGMEETVAPNMGTENEKQSGDSLVPARNVLLVEDSLISQKVIKNMLTRLGCSVVTADNGQEALTVLEQQKIDLALMDIQMPVMDGVSTLIHIRSKERNDYEHLPIIAVTAHALVGDREKYLGSGFDEYLSKPFQTDELVEKMTRVMAMTGT